MIKERIKCFKDVWKHKIAFIKVRNTNSALKTHISFWRCLIHDLGKSFNIILFGDRIATKIHRKLAGHHNFRTEKDKWEAFCDWECARYTKPEKPLNGIDTWKKFYPNIDMCEIVGSFLREELNNSKEDKSGKEYR